MSRGQILRVIVAYYSDVLRDALASSGFHWPRSMVFPVVYALGFLSLASYKGWAFATDHLISTIFLAFVPAVIVAIALFVWTLIMAPVKMESELTAIRRKLATAENELVRTHTRLVSLVNQLPQPTLTSNQRSRLKKALEEIGPHTVSIIYLDTPTSRASPYAWLFADIFREANWHVEIRGLREGYENYEKLSMNIEDGSHIRPTQKAVLGVFQSIGIQYGLIAVRDVADRVELIVGEM